MSLDPFQYFLFYWNISLNKFLILIHLCIKYENSCHHHVIVWWVGLKWPHWVVGRGGSRMLKAVFFPHNPWVTNGYCGVVFAIEDGISIVERNVDGSSSYLVYIIEFCYIHIMYHIYYTHIHNLHIIYYIH